MAANTELSDNSSPPAADPSKRNVAVLALAQGLFNCTQSMTIATTPLAALAILGPAHSQWATVPIVLVHVGIMLGTLPAALLMGQLGRRFGFTLGGLIGVVGGVTSFFGIVQPSFWLMCLGAFLGGVSGAFMWHFRFAAADTASPAFRPTAISLVMAGGVLAGFLGPQLAKWGYQLFEAVRFAGVYVFIALLGATIALLVQLIRIPNAKDESASAAPPRPIGEIMRQPLFVTAVVTSMFGYAVMTLVMSATPLAMHGCGFDFYASATVIQAHVVAMFLPSFFTGQLIKRFGLLTIIIAGALIEMVCAVINLTGITFAHFLIANVFVGLGWNFCFVGGTTLLTETYRPSERAKVQGTHDFLVYSSTALAAGLSGLLHAQAGWIVVNVAAFPLLAVVVFLALRQRRAMAAN
jgi:MFS family permease